jgi:MoxR-like ATPase
VNVERTCEIIRQALDELDRVVVGKRDAVELVLLTVLAGGHVLLEDVPGTGKTLIARSIARVLGLDFARVQFTPDLLPSDLTGAAVVDPATRELAFRPGPVFTNVLLADELNRTPPKTQAALLEAMGEYQVSSDGVTHRLPDPFVVLATDNPIDTKARFPCPRRSSTDLQPGCASATWRRPTSRPWCVAAWRITRTRRRCGQSPIPRPSSP